MGKIPALAGICNYEEAARPGYSVEENVRRLVRYAWIERRMMEVGLYWLNPTPEWEVKEALSYHLYLDTEHAGLFRERVTEMRNPPPPMDVSPDPALETFFDELLATEDTLEKLVGLYGVLKPSLLAAYKRHMAETNPLADNPTVRILRIIISEEEDMLAWGQEAIAAVIEDEDTRERADAWRSHLESYLRATGGIMGDEEPPAELPEPRSDGSFEPDYFPRRDERFEQSYNFVFPPHEVVYTPGVGVEEKTLALMCKRALEMDVPEAMASMIGRVEDEPWPYYEDMCRQLWDEARHAMMGEVYFEIRDIDWRKEIALHTAFSLRLNLDLSQKDAHLVLYAIEQGLMPAKTGKKYEWDTAVQAEDPLASLFQDYDWADEVLHAQIGRRHLLPRLDIRQSQAIEAGRKVIGNWDETTAKYEDRGEQRNWWPDFVRHALGRESEMEAYGVYDFRTSG